MAVICRDHRLLFIQAPRTGSTAVADALRSELGGEDFPGETGSQALRTAVRPKHATLGDLLRHGFLTPAARRELFVFSAVRNPFDSVLSLFVKQQRSYQALLDDPTSWIHRSPRTRRNIAYARDHTFEEWLIEKFERAPARRRVGRLVRRLRGERYAWAVGVDYVMRFERLQEDFDEVLKRVGITRRVVIPRTNVTAARGGDYRTCYSERARRIVEESFADELSDFDYAF